MGYVYNEDSAVAGARAALPFFVPTFALAVSFGALAQSLGWGVLAPIVMSLVVFSGSAQFAVAGVLGAGGGVPAAVLAAALVNARFLPMGLAVGPSLRGGRVKRAVQAQAIIDTSWALAQRRNGLAARRVLLGATVPNFVAWQAGTLAGVFGGGALGSSEQFGLDVMFPMFFLALLLPELRATRGALPAAAAAAVVTVALIPSTPPGVPVLAASLIALAGARRPR